MKTSTYNSLVSATTATTAATANLSKSATNKAIQERHINWAEHNKTSKRDLLRIYRDWYQVYRLQPNSKRIVKQSEIDKIEKLERYLSPIFFAGEFCQITTSESRAADALCSKVSAKTNKTHYLVPIRWTVSSLESAIKYCAKYYAGIEVDIESRLNNIK